MSFTQKYIPHLGLTCLLIAAFFSIGFHHFDEHFQILEFAGSRLGLSSSSDLPWEYQAQMRSSFQPSIVLLVHKILAIFQSKDPFLAALILRLLSAVLSWLAISRIF
ncbi:MAG: hypothetical protein ACKN9V_06035, partial [Pseudomonadota bacterium]